MDSIHGEIRQFEYKFKDQIKRILSSNAILRHYIKDDIELSSDYEDCNYSYDMKYNVNISLMVSVRIRKNKYLMYRDFTIRSRSLQGYPCEIDKLLKQTDDFDNRVYFYAWMDKLETIMEDWIIVDINKIRYKLKEEGKERENTDGTKFKAYSIHFLNQNNAIMATKGQQKLNFVTP